MVQYPVVYVGGIAGVGKTFLIEALRKTHLSMCYELKTVSRIMLALNDGKNLQLLNPERLRFLSEVALEQIIFNDRNSTKGLIIDGHYARVVKHGHEYAISLRGKCLSAIDHFLFLRDSALEILERRKNDAVRKRNIAREEIVRDLAIELAYANLYASRFNKKLYIFGSSARLDVVRHLTVILPKERAAIC